MNILYLLILGIIFLAIGSFLNVCIFRIPFGYPKGLDGFDDFDEKKFLEERKKLPKISFLYPARSICPKCLKNIKWYHNIPILSFLLLKGRCAYCSNKISFQYPLVEFISLCFGMLSIYMHDLPTAIFVFIITAALIIITFIDFEYYIIPNVISLPGIVIGFIVGFLNAKLSIFSLPISQSLMDSFLGFLVGGVFLYIVSRTYYLLRKRVGLGDGDIKLMAMIGALCGPIGAISTMFIGSLLGTVIGGIFILTSKNKANRPIPFGPALACGCLVYLYTDIDLIFYISNKII